MGWVRNIFVVRILHMLCRQLIGILLVIVILLYDIDPKLYAAEALEKEKSNEEKKKLQEENKNFYKEKKEYYKEEEHYKQYYTEMEKKWGQLQKICHDIQNNYVLELGYLEEQKYEQLWQHYQSVLGMLKQKSHVICTGNIGIDAIVSYKMELAKSCGITVEEEICIPQKVNVSNEHLSVLLGNLLDNAIEAVKDLEEDRRKISLRLKMDKTVLLIMIKNFYKGNRTKDEKGDYITNKEDQLSHGIGLKSVKEIVESYHGIMEISDDHNEFKVKIIMYT